MNADGSRGEAGNSRPAPAMAGRTPRVISLGVALLVLAVALGLTFAAAATNNRSNGRLLQLQVNQAGAAVTASLPVNTVQLADGLQVAVATRGSTTAFRRFFASKLLPAGSFVAASLWQVAASGPREIAAAGSPLALVASGESGSFLMSVRPTGSLYVTGILPSGSGRLGYAEMPKGGSGFLVYVEEDLPPGRHIPVPASSAFNDLNFALYLGRDQAPADLLAATTAVPLAGPTAVDVIPFGDTFVTIVGSPTSELTGSLSQALPWIVLGAGIVLAIASAAVVDLLARRRRTAELLAEANRRLYRQQRDIAGTLQRALLPQKFPAFEGLEIAGRYLPGAPEVEVGGDWYDVVPLAGGSCLVVVGDVSGRGLPAATTMVSLRYTLRAYARLGEAPDALLARLNDLVSIDEDRQFATVLLAQLDVARREATFASAGHFPPLVVGPGTAAYAELDVAPPLGVDHAGARATAKTIAFPAGATLLFFTDGLVERRDEVLSTGLERLRAATLSLDHNVGTMVDQLISRLVAGDADDDTVLLGVQWAS